MAGAHGALLIAFAAGAPPSGAPATTARSVEVRTLSVSARSPVLAQAAAPSDSGRAGTTPAQPGSPVAADESPRQRARPMQTEATSAPEPPEPASPPASTQPGPAEPVTSADETSAPASARSASAQPPSADLDPFDYVPRRFLSVAPKPQGAVVLQYPEGDAEADAVTFVLSLYIDEQGRVRHVRVDEGSPPERFVTAAVATFMQAHFEPGELQGQPVRSLVRVEVSYRVSR